MCRKLVYLVCCALLLSLAGSARADLVAYWDLDEGTGSVVHDRSGNGNDGTLHGPEWGPGKYGDALRFNGTNSYVEVPTSDSLEIDGQVTIAAWINWIDAGDTWLCIMANGQQNGPWENYGLFINRTSRFVYFTLSLGGQHVVQQTPNNVIAPDGWHHVSASWDGSAARVYVDGQLQLEQAQSGTLVPPALPLRLGHRNGSTHFYNGIIDDAAVFDHALTELEIQDAMEGIAPAELASDPSPEDAALDIPRDVVLSWTPGRFAHAHDVYLGEAFEDVNAAGRTDPMGVLASQGQTASTWSPADLLAFGQTYYWRVDEVNAPPDSTIFRGQIWSFTTEPFAYPVASVVATSNGSSEAAAGPQNTVNGSGLDPADQHSTARSDMWLATPGADPLWIQFEFDRIYKLHQMLVWNYNVQFELILGFGIKAVTVEYSENGTDWTRLGDVELARATAKATYTANTTVDFGGVPVQYVRLNVNSGYGMMGQYGLSEVRFLYIPAQAREPQPADGAADVEVGTALAWRRGREAVSHQVYLGTDPDALTLAGTVDVAMFAPALEFGSTYYWQVDEVNEADAVTTWAGDLWSFSTQEYALIDGFETYNDDVDAGTTIFDTWLDGWVNETGSTVGYLNAPFAEQTIIHSGKQSMPLAYDNSVSPFYSEAWREFETAQDWTGHGADRLVLYVRGNAPDFVETADGGIIMNAIGTDIWSNSDQFRYAYKSLSGDGSIAVRVDSLIRSNEWAKAGVMIRETLDAGSAHAFVAVTPDYGAVLQRRPVSDQASVSTDGVGIGAPRWVKLTRTGNAFVAQESADGVTWTDFVVSPALEIPMAGDVYIGLALTSHATAATGAEFSNISTTGNVTGTWQTAEVGVAQPAGSQAETMYVTIEDSAGNIATVVNSDEAITLHLAWQEWSIPYSELSGVDLGRVNKMVIGVGSRTAPTAGGADIVYVDDIGYGRPAAE